MKLEIRRVINIDDDIDARALTPLENILVGIRKAWLLSSRYERNQNAKAEKEYIRLSKLKSKCKEDILKYCLKYLLNNELPESYSGTISVITLRVPREYEEVLDEVITYKEFSPFIITKVPMNPDLLISFPNAALQIEIRKKNI